MILPRHRRVVLWGLRQPTGDSFQHIWRHYAHALERLRKPWVWLPDASDSREEISPRDLVFAVDVAAEELGAPADGADYVLHNILETHPVRRELPPERHIYIQVWTSDCAERGEAWGPVRRWDRHSRVLYQPWGTDLLADEFYPPVFRAESRFAVFVGSVWDGNGQGNADAIGELRRALDGRGISLDHRTGVDDATNAELVRESRIAPAVTGRWQVEHDYLPCRVFKNVSYGALAITNVPAFERIFGFCAGLGNRSISELVAESLEIGEDLYLDMVREYQRIVAENYTYRHSLAAIERAFEEGR